MLVSHEQQQLAEAEGQLFARIAAALEGQRPPLSARAAAWDRPRIGVFAAGRGTLREGAWQVYGADQYTIDAIAEAGGYPQVLPSIPIVPGLDPFDLLANYDDFRFVFNAVWPVVRELDGLVLTGGGDLDSRFFYRKIPHPRLGPADLWRDTWEWFSTLLCYATCKTTFGICRGLQLMNVARRGGLFQDHEELRKFWKKGMPPLLAHRRGRPIFKNFIDHPLHIVPGSWLEQATRGEPEHTALHHYLDEVWTQHHNFVGVLVDPAAMEIVGDLADGLVVSAYAPDGVIEAIASAEPQRIYIAVQFHPEYVRTLAWASNIFRYVVAGAARDGAIDRAVFESFREELLAWLWLCARTLHNLRTTGNATERRTDELQQEPALASVRAR